jgi:hypothetical protein
LFIFEIELEGLVWFGQSIPLIHSLHNKLGGCYLMDGIYFRFSVPCRVCEPAPLESSTVVGSFIMTAYCFLDTKIVIKQWQNPLFLQEAKTYFAPLSNKNYKLYRGENLTEK